MSEETKQPNEERAPTPQEMGLSPCEYCGSKDLEKDFTPLDRNFFELELPFVMALAEISYICPDTVHELQWRGELMTLWTNNYSDEDVSIRLSKFIGTKMPGVKTTCRMEWLRNKFMGKVGSQRDKKWAASIEKQKDRKLKLVK